MRGVVSGLCALAAAVLAVEARAADERGNPLASFGLHLVDDLALKWRDTLPELTGYGPDDAPPRQPWAVFDADTSIPARRGRVKVGLGVGRLGLQIDSNATMDGLAARVRVRFRLEAGVGRLVLRLPDVKITPRIERGEVRFDYIVPLIEHRF